MRLNLGCGHVHAASWMNVDGSNRAWLASRLPWLDRLFVTLRLIAPTEFNAKTVYANLLRRFPWGDKSVEAIYMGEILEHFTQSEGERVLRECYRVLRPSGLLRIRVPDHARFWKQYVEEYERTKQQPHAQWSLAHTRWTAMYFRDLCVRRPHIWQSMGHYHKWMYDEISLILLVEAVGFENVERRVLHQSGIPQIEEVEVREELIIEATRP
jgi:predicted SAM-dependent methyltransferase